MLLDVLPIRPIYNRPSSRFSNSQTSPASSIRHHPHSQPPLPSTLYPILPLSPIHHSTSPHSLLHQPFHLPPIIFHPSSTICHLPSANQPPNNHHHPTTPILPPSQTVYTPPPNNSVINIISHHDTHHDPNHIRPTMIPPRPFPINHIQTSKKERWKGGKKTGKARMEENGREW